MCVQTRLMRAIQGTPRAQKHGAWQCKAPEVSMICKMEKIFSAESSLEMSCRCLRKISHVNGEVGREPDRVSN